MVSLQPKVLFTAPHKALFAGPNAWSKVDFPSLAKGYYHLRRETLAELDRAAARIAAAGKDIFSTTKYDFPLPSFAADAAMLRELLCHGAGWIIVKGLPIECYTDQEACLLYWGLGTHLGRPIAQNVHGGLLYSVRDEGYTLERDYGMAGVRTSKTTSGLNYHTDSPCLLAGNTPDIVCLLALQTAKSGGESAIISGNTVHNILLEERPDYLQRLYQPYHVDRRAELPAGEESTMEVPVFAFANHLRVRYLRLYITKGYEVAGLPLTEADIAPLDFLDSVMRRQELPVTFGMERGDMQFVNNVFILHSRTEFQDHPEPERKRHYVRLWLA